MQMNQSTKNFVGYTFFTVLTAFASMLITVAISNTIAFAQPPGQGLSLPCKVVKVYDGDTVTVDVTIRCRVRLIDCWAPELRDPGGKESQKHLAQIALDKNGTLQIPSANAKACDENTEGQPVTDTAINNLVTVGIYTIGTIIMLIGVAMRVSWQAGQLTQAVKTGTESIDELNEKVGNLEKQIDDKFDNHSGRIQRLELHVWPGHELGQG